MPQLHWQGLLHPEFSSQLISAGMVTKESTMHRTLQYKKKALQQAHLDNVNSVLPFESALYDRAQEEQKPISKIALKRKGVPSEAVEGLFDYYVEEKRARIELNCSIAQKMQWKVKDENAQNTHSK